MVVCKECSNKKWLLPQQASKPLRVCLTCYNRLSQSKNSTPFGGKQNINVHANLDF